MWTCAYYVHVKCKNKMDSLEIYRKTCWASEERWSLDEEEHLLTIHRLNQPSNTAVLEILGINLSICLKPTTTTNQQLHFNYKFLSMYLKLPKN